MNFIELNKLQFGYINGAGEVAKIFSELNVVISEGEIFTIRGPNGVGKTTLLNLIAGEIKPSSGSVVYGYGSRPEMGYVQQDYSSSLLPWWKVVDNITVPLKVKGKSKKIREAVSRQLLDELGFANLPLDRYPHQLSGGQRQRVALARAIIQKPKLLLLDEPFSSLDSSTIKLVEEFIVKANQMYGITIVLVSHDLNSSAFVSDRIFYINPKEINGGKVFDSTLTKPRERGVVFSDQYQDLIARIRKYEGISSSVKPEGSSING